MIRCDNWTDNSDVFTDTSQPEYGVVISKEVMIPMRDGIELAADIYRPAINGEFSTGQFPTILGRTSYDRTNPVIWVDPVANFFTPRGYVTVLQDLRGRGDSQGTGEYFHTANVNEGPDGYDTVEWIAAQPWSNQRVGMVGSSHGGIVQNVAALHRPPHLTALWVDVAPTSAFDWEARQGGAMALHMFGALFLHGWDAQEIQDNPEAKQLIEHNATNLRELLWQFPFKSGCSPISLVPNLEEVLMHYTQDGLYNEWWAMEAMEQKYHYHRFPDIPIVFSGGWYDPFVDDYSKQFTHLSSQNQSPQRLIIGPWNHMTMRGKGSTNTGQVEFGPDAKWGDQTYNQHRLRWFDRWLKDFRTNVEKDTPVRIFVMGGGSGQVTTKGQIQHGGKWRGEPTWPIERAKTTTLYMHSKGTLSTDPPSNVEPPLFWIHDPGHPVPTISANVTGFYEWLPVPNGMDPAYLPARARMESVINDGPVHQKETPGLVGCKQPYPLLSDRVDVQAFQSNPLKSDLEITGIVSVILWVSSSAKDTDFTARLLDIYPPSEKYPNGFHMPVADSILRARYREGYDREIFMEPGKIYKITIPLPPTSNLFSVDHQIRIDISSSNFPRFDINPNTGEPVGRHTYTTKATNSVHFDPEHPSCVTVPVVRG